MRASPSSASPRASHSSSASHRLGFPDELVESSDRAGPSISFGAPADDRMSITASGDELGSGDDDSAALPPSGRVVLPESDPETDCYAFRAAESVGLQWRPLLLPNARGWTIVVPGGAGRSPATASGSILPGGA